MFVVSIYFEQMRVLHAQKHLGLGVVIYWTITPFPFPKAIKIMEEACCLRRAEFTSPRQVCPDTCFHQEELKPFNSTHKMLLIGFVHAHNETISLCDMSECSKECKGQS